MLERLTRRLLRHRSVPHACQAPDGSAVALVWNAADTHQLWRQDLRTAARVKLATARGGRVQEVVWSPRGDILVFAAEQIGTERTRLCVVPAGGGKVRPLAEHGGRSATAWEALGAFSPAGNALYYTCQGADASRTDLVCHDLRSSQERVLHSEHQCDLRVDCVHPSGEALLVTRTIIDHYQSEILVVDTRHGEVSPLSRGTKPEAGVVAWSGRWTAGGSRILYLSNTRKREERTSLCEASIGGSEDVLLRFGDADVELFAELQGGRLIAAANRDGRSALYQVGRSARTGILLQGAPRGVCRVLEAGPGDRLLVVCDDELHPADVFLYEVSSGASVRLSSSLATEVDQERLAVGEVLFCRSRDGTKVPAFLYRPPGPTTAAVVVIHGGPTTQARREWNVWVQTLVAEGYAVLVPNVRGSTGYGMTYSHADDHDWGGKPLDDLVGGADELIRRGIASHGKVAALGGSYGGYLAMAALAFRPETFCAAVSLAGLSDLEAFRHSVPGGSPVARYLDSKLGRLPEDASALRSRSPLRAAERIRAPLLLVQGALDARTTVSQAREMQRAIERIGGRVELLLVADEGHDIQRRRNRVRVVGQVLRFLGQSLA